MEHAAGCTECAARVEELRGILVALADLPEPEIPANVLARLDATIEQAWQEADETALALSRSAQRREKQNWWRRLAVPITALAVFAGALVGVGYLITRAGSGATTAAASSSGVTSAGTGAVPEAGANADPTLTAMARAALGPELFNGSEAGPAARKPTAPTASMNADSKEVCDAPEKSGFTVETIVAETYAGRDARLVVYRDDKEPADSTTFYVVLYAGSCPIGSSAVLLDQGLVSLSR
ncbi:hypothetical protein [Actinospica durhamensis]|uniref:hypothetical protein n=1 Tax=Actinospica durhamensis TaxID=1508375 RepID=UPI001BA73409|nr:hypothetical protein [Actinospica durhamensis]